MFILSGPEENSTFYLTRKHLNTERAHKKRTPPPPVKSFEV